MNRFAHDISFNDTSAHIVIRNYLEFDQLSPKQEAELMITPRSRGAQGIRLGDGWLMPAPFRRLKQDGPVVVVAAVPREPPPLLALVGGAEQ